MPIQSATIRKLLRENFSGANPIRLTKESRELLVNEIRTRIDNLSGVKVENNYYLQNAQKENFLLAFTIKDPDEDRYYGSSKTFHLRVGAQSRLTISDRFESAFVSDADEIFDLISACQQRFDRQFALKKRRQMVRDLKAQAIIATIKKLAKEEKFDFATDTNTRELKLYVRLSEEDCMELHIPFKDFEERLPQLRASLQSVRKLYEEGVRFNLRSTKKIGWRSQWVSHESLD